MVSLCVVCWIIASVQILNSILKGKNHNICYCGNILDRPKWLKYGYILNVNYINNFQSSAINCMFLFKVETFK